MAKVLKIEHRGGYQLYVLGPIDLGIEVRTKPSDSIDERAEGFYLVGERDGEFFSEKVTNKGACQEAWNKKLGGLAKK